MRRFVAVLTVLLALLAGCSDSTPFEPEPVREVCPQAGDEPPCAPDQTRNPETSAPPRGPKGCNLIPAVC
jgi:hypothetical protein